MTWSFTNRFRFSIGTELEWQMSCFVAALYMYILQSLVVKETLYRWPNFRCVMKQTTGMAEKGNACRILVGKPEGRKHLGRTRRKGEDGFKEIEWGCADWIHPTPDRASGGLL